MDIYMRFPEGKAKAFTLSFDDGVYQDKRLVELMKRYGIKGTFNINSGTFKDSGSGITFNNRMTKQETAETFKNSGQEIAAHGLHHGHLQAIPPATVLAEALEEREILEEMFGSIVRGMAYPYGGYSDKTIDALKAAGIVYSRTVESTGHFNIPVNGGDEWMKLAPTCHFADEKAREYAEKFVVDTPSVFPEMFYVWGHSYEFDNNGGSGYERMEKLIETVAGKEDIWYATNIEIYDYFKAYNRLCFTMRGTAAYNPNAISVWVCRKGKNYEIKPGMTRCFKEEE